MTKDQMEKLRKVLLQEKEEIEHRLKETHHYGLDQSMEEAVGNITNDSNHPADTASEMFEREKDYALNKDDEHRLVEVNEAFKRMEEGRYGICKVCNQEIPYDRLVAIPYTQYCIEDAP
jgi:RNA polymerase-binding transcription factor DksA